MDGAQLTAERSEAGQQVAEREEQLSILVGQILSPGAKLASQLTSAGGALASQIKQTGREATSEAAAAAPKQPQCRSRPPKRSRGSETNASRRSRLQNQAR